MEIREIKKALITKQDIAIGLGKVEQVRNKSEYKLDMLNANNLGAPIIAQHYDQLIDSQHPYYIDPDKLQDPKLVYTADKGLFVIYDDVEKRWRNVSNNIAIFDSFDKVETDFVGHNVVFITDPIKGGFFIYDGTKRHIDNGGTIIKGWVRIFEGDANIKWFGAVGDGIEDDTECFKNALKYHNNILIPEGVYNITSTLEVSNSKIRGFKGKSVIKTILDITLLAPKSNTLFKDLVFEGLRSTQNQILVSIDGGENKEISNIEFDGCMFKNSNKAVRAKDLFFKTLFKSCEFKNFDTGFDIFKSAEDILIKSCRFNDILRVMSCLSSKVTIESCLFDNNDRCLRFESIKDSKAKVRLFDSVFSKNKLDLSLWECSDAFEAEHCEFTSDIELFNTDKCYFTSNSIGSGVDEVLLSFNSSSFNNFISNRFYKVNIDQDVGGDNSYNEFKDNTYISDNSESRDTNINIKGFVLQEQALPASNVKALYSLILHQVDITAPNQKNFTFFKFYDDVNRVFDLTHIKEAKYKVRFDGLFKNAGGAQVSVMLVKLEDLTEKFSHNNLQLNRIVAKSTPLTYYTGGADARYFHAFEVSVDEGFYAFYILDDLANRASELMPEGAETNNPNKIPFSTGVTIRRIQ